MASAKGLGISSSASRALAAATTPSPSPFRWRLLVLRTAAEPRRRIAVAHMRCGFDEFEEAPAEEAQILVFAALTRSCERLLVSTETVEQDRGVNLLTPTRRPSPLAAVRGGRLDQATASP